LQVATATGLRHGFGVIAVESEVPLPWIREWMGHSSLEITASYTSVHKHSDREIVARMWEAPADDSPLKPTSEIH
jgi:integrase/recombinase XerD